MAKDISPRLIPMILPSLLVEKNSTLLEWEQPKTTPLIARTPPELDANVNRSVARTPRVCLPVMYLVMQNAVSRCSKYKDLQVAEA